MTPLEQYLAAGGKVEVVTTPPRVEMTMTTNKQYGRVAVEKRNTTVPLRTRKHLARISGMKL